MKLLFTNGLCLAICLCALLPSGNGQVIITGNEEPLTIDLPRDINCTWGGSGNVSTMEWFIVGLEDRAFETATETNSVVLSLNPDDSGLDGAMFLCRVTLSSGQTAEETIALRVEAIENTVTITEETNATAGEPYTLICTVSSARPSNLTWIDPNGVACPLDHPHTTLTYSGWEAGSSRLELTFHSIRTSQSGTYKCVSNIGYPTSKSEATFVVVIQIPEPNIIIQRKPVHPVQLLTTDSLVLTCVIELIPEVDSYVTINSQWRGHSSLTDRQRRVIISELEGLRLIYNTSVRFSTLKSSDSGSYICSATVTPQRLNDNLVESQQTEEKINISVVLKVTIDVTYNSPSDFDLPSPPYYRPGTSVSLTCRAHHANGSVTYQWSSTCSSCFASSSTSQSISDSILRSNDAGNHTCRVTDSVGNTGSNTTVMKLIGTGVYVTSSQLLNSAPITNNSFVIHGSCYYCNAIDVYCYTNSTSSVTGSYIYPNGAEYSSSNSYNYYTSHEQTGVRLYASVYYYGSPGIYGIFTCKLPDAEGNMVEKSIGIYSSTPSAPSVYSIRYNDLSSRSSAHEIGTVECVSRNSPPTNVSWLRDGKAIKVDRIAYDMIQKVTERRSYSQYSNVLLIRDALQLAGNHNYCCIVSNSAGTSPSRCVNTTWTEPTVSISSDEALYSKPFKLICKASLQSKVAKYLLQYMTVHWIDNNGSYITATEGRFFVENQQNYSNYSTKTLVFDPLDMEQGGDYNCEARVVLPGMAESFNTTVDHHLNVINRTIIQLKFGQVAHCSKWYEQWDSPWNIALQLKHDLKENLVNLIEENCSCDFRSLNNIDKEEFSCRSVEEGFAVYRARITGSSDTMDIPSLLDVINDWKTNDGTFLYNFHTDNMIRLGLDTYCPIEIASFSQPECQKHHYVKTEL